MRVAVCQLQLSVGNLEENRAAGVAAIEKACSEGAHLVVLPELSDTGYVFTSQDEARQMASSAADSPTLAGWTAMARAHGVIIVGGWCERGDDGTLYNSATCVGPRGPLLHYRKLHLWDREREVFAPGAQLSPIVELDSGVRLGVAICYDLEFPELVRLLALAGADLLAVPTNWPASTTPSGERPIEFVKAQASAATNGIWIALADRCGPERGVDWLGLTTVLTPEGFPAVAPLVPDAPGIVTTEIDPLRSRTKALNTHNDLLLDRRLDLYGLTRRPATPSAP